MTGLIYKIATVVLCSFLIVSCERNYDLSYQDGFNPEGGDSTPIDIDTSMSNIDRSKLNRARVYPGIVDLDVARLNNINVSLDLSVLPQSSTVYRIQQSQIASFSVGLYAPPGELIKIVVPNNIYGLVAQIGVHRDDLSAIESPRRDPVIFTRKSLAPGVNFVRNPYGGLIWINADIAYPTPVQLSFSGVSKSADFILGETNDATWRQEVLASKVPWLELRSPSIAFSVPTEKMKAFIRDGIITSPTEVMTEWEAVFGEDFYSWMGFEEANSTNSKVDQKPKTPERLVLDIHPVVGYAHSGSPVVAQDDKYWLDEIVNIRTIRSGGVWGIAHEFGHNYQQVNIWSWNGLGETTNNLFVFKVANRNGQQVGQHPQVNARFPEAVKNAAERGADILANATTKRHANHHNLGNAFYKITPFAQIFHKLRDLNNPANDRFGWNFMPYLYKKARHAEFLSVSDIDKRDFFYEALCDYAKQDFQLFFDVWDIKLSDYSKSRMAQKYPAMKTKLWEYQPLTGVGGNTPIN